MGLPGNAPWPTVESELRLGLDYLNTLVGVRVIQVFKGEDIPAQIRLKQFGSYITDIPAHVGSPGDRQIVFIYPFTVPGSNDVVWVMNQNWCVTGDVVQKEADGETIDRVELESRIAAACQAPYEGLTFGGKDSSGPIHVPPEPPAYLLPLPTVCPR